MLLGTTRRLGGCTSILLDSIENFHGEHWRSPAERVTDSQLSLAGAGTGTVLLVRGALMPFWPDSTAKE